MSETAPSSLAVHILWGSVCDPESAPSSYEFATEAELNSFWKGLNEADGYMDLEEVDSPDYRVNADGEIVPRKLKTPTAIKPNSRFVVWGEYPEAGTTASTYEFESAPEAEAFMLGAGEMVGWMGYHEVPAPDYHYLGDGRAHLSQLGELAANALVECENFSPDDVFMGRDGAFVEDSWASGDTINDFVPRLEQSMRQTYSIGLLDAGVDAKMLAGMMNDYEDRPQEAADWFGEKYDLTRNEEVGIKRPRM